MHVSGEAGLPPSSLFHFFPTGLHSLLTSSLALHLLAHVGKKRDGCVCQAQGGGWCVVCGVESSGLTGWVVPHTYSSCCCVVSHAAGEEGKRKFPGVGDPVFFFFFPLVWHGMA